MTGWLIVSGLAVLAAWTVTVTVQRQRDVRRIRAMEGERLADWWVATGKTVRAERGSIADDIATSRTEANHE